MKKGGSLLLFSASVGFILVAVLFSFVIDKSKNSAQTDLRTKAVTRGIINFYATVDSYDDEVNTLIVRDLKFADTQGESLGVWEINAPPDFSPTRYPAGTPVIIEGKAASFQVSSHTLTAATVNKRLIN
ncbi:hypothetical protein A2154_02505 [Candidatus Gottesmanbacteria bacterium RBG_16_43_7]|uniref:Uncharacterized protein n=1 Tax=Candidatus Gottesmanbacteria bacterium RBG_16_43_7 TaxID=1798373 RepID=A0A1F5ZCT3_9BACT|nr:MAG: hypothetical protein A2154_02505 [Candidatus Gottesmanbacteria bacterium RBG_16_43_7]